VKPVHLVCACLMLAAAVLLAQSGSSPLADHANGLPVALEIQGPPQVPHGPPVAQAQPKLHGAWALGAHSRRRNVKASNPVGPEQVLYAFQPSSFGGNVEGDGYFPYGGLIFDSKRNLYGTTYFGGTFSGECVGYDGWGCGTVFELSPNGSGGWTETILYSFQGGTDGWDPNCGLIFDQAGNLYGTTPYGGSNGTGTVFELSPNGSGGWTETVLYSFGAYTNDGARPSGTLVFDKSGNLYGAASEGGQGLCPSNGGGCGAVFELSPKIGGGWTESTLYSFTGGADGESPNSPPIFDQSGNLYGTTKSGGNASVCIARFPPPGCGTVFELSPNGKGGWTEMTLYTFQGGNDGGNSSAGLIFDPVGNLYGTTEYGGGGGCSSLFASPGCGTAFELSPSSTGGWTETILHSFQVASDGENPYAGLIFDQSGNLYGTTTGGPNGGDGTVFELIPNESGGWTESIVYSFQGTNYGGPPNDGQGPYGGVILDQAGNLYGTTELGGVSLTCNDNFFYGCGTVFEVFKEPAATFSPTSGNFIRDQTPGVPSSPLVMTLTDSGGLPLTITSIQITGANSGDFSQTNNCPASLAPFNSCQISVIFTPLAGRDRAAELQVADNAPGSPQAASLTGFGQDFSVAVTSQTSVTVTPGQAANYAIAVSPVNLAQKVALSCSGAPPQSTCTVSPSSVTLDGIHSAPASVAVVTSKASADLVYPAGLSSTGIRLALWLALPGLPGLLLLGGGSGKRRARVFYGLLLLSLLAATTTWFACGGGSGSSGGGGGGTPAATYTLTVTGTFTSGSAVVKHAVPLTLIVQ
jgi:uncharacterized repeat protein (TIGR03803 family)